MIGTNSGMILAIVNLAIAGVLGSAAGGLLSAILRRPWGLKAIGIDAFLAIVTAIVGVYVLTHIVNGPHTWVSIVAPVWIIAVLSVVMELTRFRGGVLVIHQAA